MRSATTPDLRRALVLRLLVCALPLLFAGCKSASYGYGGAMAPGYAGDEDYYEYEEEAPGGEDYREYELDNDSPVEARSAPKRKSMVFADKADNKKERRAEPPSDSVSTQTATTDSSSAEAPLEVEAPPSDEAPAPAPSMARQIIYTATMQVSVYDLAHALEVVEALPDRFGGWMHQRVDNQVVLRVPAAQLKQVMAVVAELGVVDYRLLEALDVTAEYTDLESRIRVLTQMQAHLQALLSRAESVEQALEIRRALDEVTLELEVARAHMRELSKSIAFSTLILRLVERGPGQELPASNDPFPWVDELGVEATAYR